ncbi:MAG: hypothetical protein WCK42_01560 [Myxococcaceae bacterium]
MHVLTVRQIPDSLYDTLAALARRNRRSLQQQAMMLLERCRFLDTESSPVERARSIRSSLSNLQLGDVVQDVRTERDR